MSILSFCVSPEDYMLPCLSKRLLNIECFGCGIQRSVLFLFRGEFLEAFKMYPAIYTLIPLFALIGISTFYKNKLFGKLINYLAITSIALVLINFIYKLII